MNFDINKKFTIQEIIQMDTDIDFVNLDFNGQTELFDQLKELLMSQNNQVLFDHRYDYTRWMTLVTWDRLNSLSAEDVVSSFHKTIPEALLFGIDIWKDLMWYFNTIFIADIELLEKTYRDIKSALWNSDAIIGRMGENFLYVKDVIQEIERNERQKVDAIKSAELSTKIERAFFSEEFKELNNEYVLENPDKIIRRFIDLIHFFMGVDAKDIHYVVNAFVNMPIEKVTNVISPQAPSIEPVLSITQKPTEPSIAQLSQKSHYHDVQEELEIMFRYDSQGELQPIEDVLAKLSELAQKYDDPHIEELYYFDEEEGKFVWNGDLL